MEGELTRILEELGMADVSRSPQIDRLAEAVQAVGDRSATIARACLATQTPFVHRHLGPRARADLEAAEPSGRARVRAIADELCLDDLERLDDHGLRERLIADTLSARAFLQLFRDDESAPLRDRARSAFPELAALATAADAHASIEHQRTAGGERPLLDHLAERTLSRKLLGLERADGDRFQSVPTLSAEAFHEEVEILRGLERDGLGPLVRAALIHLDFAKGGTLEQRATWADALGADLSIHNVAARRILEGSGTLERWPSLRRDRARIDLVLALVESHGLTGQTVRGETPLASFAPFVRHLRSLSSEHAVGRAVSCLHVINTCDTAAVREGLLDDALRGEMTDVERRIQQLAVRGTSLDLSAIERELLRAEEQTWEERLPETPAPLRTRARVVDRLLRLRKGRIASGEPRERTERALSQIADPDLERLAALLAPCQLWYAEAALASLSPESQLKLLAIGLKAAELRAVDVTRPFHLSLLPLVAKLNARAGGPTVSYRARLIEALTESLSIEDVLRGAPSAMALLGGRGELPIVVFTTEIGREKAIALSSQESEEASALLVLLSIYEQKSSAAFHATLKALCDLYGLRKDELDRVSNEAMYLEHMNSARADKERMLDYVLPGRIVEVGPGGGVVLDLLEARFPGSRIVGIDKSRVVVEALEQTKRSGSRSWSVIEGDAFELGGALGGEAVDTVVFCSVLHEIYSYVGERFRIESVRDILRAAYEALRPGGRIVIRDGVMPPEGTRIIRFLSPDARPFFETFAAQFEARKVIFEAIGSDRVKLASRDAMEFLYKYTWGPASFPYEIREQYGVLPYAEYTRRILEWLASRAHPPRLVPLPPSIASYLQPGYERGLKGKVELFDGEGNPARLPDSNALMVIEKSVGEP
jgi:SAM-dependent methyltransferase